MIRIALRANIWPAIAMAAFVSVFLAFLAASYIALGGDRAKAAKDLMTLSSGWSFLLPIPSRLDTVPAYLAWFGFGQFGPMLGIWSVILGTGASRADEERGLVEQWIAGGVSRWRAVVSQLVAFTVAAAVALTIGDGLGWAATVAGGEPASFTGLLVQTAGLLALMALAFALGQVSGQLFATRRGAAGAAATVLVTLFFLNSLSRQSADLVPYRWLSPFFYYDRVHGLVPDDPVDAGALVTLLLATLALLVLALIAFLRRDVGATLIARTAATASLRTPSSNPLLATPTFASLFDQRFALLVWAIAVVAQGSFLLRLSHAFLQALAAADASDPSTTQLRLVTGSGHGSPYEGFLGFEWFSGTFALGMAAFAITQVSRWAGEDSDGRLEALLSAPFARSRVVVERALALFAAVAFFVIVDHIAMSLETKIDDVALDQGRLAAAGVMLVPVAGVFGGLGAALSAWRPRVAIAALSAFAFVSFMIPFATPVIRAPEWVRRLSVFDLYGTPLADGLELWRLATLTSVTLLGFVVAGFALHRRDVGR